MVSSWRKSVPTMCMVSLCAVSFWRPWCHICCDCTCTDTIPMSCTTMSQLLEYSQMKGANLRQRDLDLLPCCLRLIYRIHWRFPSCTCTVPEVNSRRFINLRKKKEKNATMFNIGCDNNVITSSSRYLVIIPPSEFQSSSSLLSIISPHQQIMKDSVQLLIGRTYVIFKLYCEVCPFNLQ